MRHTETGRVLWGAVAILAVLLGVLGTLQYRWLGRLSEIEEERMRASVELSTRRFAADLNSELTAAFAHFQRGLLPFEPPTRGVGGPGGPGSHEGERAHRGGSAWSRSRVAETSGFDDRAIELLVTWQEQATFPELFRELYWWPDGAGGTVLRHEAGTAGFEAVDGVIDPEELSVVSRGGRPSLPYSESLEGLVVALFDPASDGRFRPRGGSPGPPTRPAGFLVVRLDRSHLIDDVFPELGRLHFAGAEGESFDFAVLQADGELLFASRPGIEPSSWTPPNGPDGEEQLLRLLAPGEGRAMRLGEVLGRKGSGRSAGLWRLVVRHADGSLNAAVARARTRNLAIGTGVLVLLLASVGALTFATRRAQELANQQLEFVAGVSHELRTPLASMRSLGENLADGIVESGEQVQRYGEQITRQSARLGELVDQVLSFAGGLSERRPLESAPVALDEVVHAAVRECETLRAQVGGAIDLDLTPSLPEITGDRAALRGAVRNLLANALKYGGASPSVRIEGRSERAVVELVVEDGGLGIAAADRARVFEPFYRSESVREAQIEGTGLGLALVRDVAEAHGGEVQIDDAPGGGARLTLRLPAVVREGKGA